jgi:hypothetical protein
MRGRIPVQRWRAGCGFIDGSKRRRRKEALTVERQRMEKHRRSAEAENILW